VRQAAPADSEQVLSVIVRAIRISAVGYYPEAALASWASDFTESGIRRSIETTDSFVAVDGPRVVGFVNLEVQDVDLLFVDPDYGGRGVARRMYAQVERLARRRGLSRLTATASARAEPVFLQFGFQVTSRFVLTDDKGMQFDLAAMAHDLGTGGLVPTAARSL
jgi:putative acetyltransferase